MTAFELSINSYGNVQGFIRPNNTIAEVRGIPYAIVPERFRSPILCKTLDGKFHDGTQFGPSCPQIYNEHDPWIRTTFPPYAGQVRKHTWDDLKCTNLNVTFPASVLKGNLKDLPVMVYIHGGSFKQGSANEPRHDGWGFVDVSIQIGRPVVFVGINYRLGYFGFLSSKELLDANVAVGDVSAGNYGLLDQRVALEWIHANIAAFGGDPENITIFGNSSGAVSCSAHLQSISRSLFKQAIMQSGACIGVAKPLDLNHKYHRSRFARLTKALFLDDLPQTEKIEKLRAVPWKHLVGAVMEIENPDGMFCITADYDLIGGFFQLLKTDNTDKRLIIGNTGHDGYAFYDFAHKRGTERCRKLILHLPEPLHSVYSNSSADEDKWIKGVLDFITDTLYAGGTQAGMIKGGNIKAFSYVWARPNPVPLFASEFPGIATHCTEMIYTTGLYLDELNEDDQKLSRTMVERWVLFACGLDPWKSRQPERYDLTASETGLKERFYGNSEYRRVDAQDYICQNIDIYGDILREFLEESDGEILTS